MTKDKWCEIINDSGQKFNNKSFAIAARDGEYCPENWNEIKNCYQAWIKEVDEATEVYNMENKRS